VEKWKVPENTGNYGIKNIIKKIIATKDLKMEIIKYSDKKE